ncbi:hypothetical protein ASG19_21700 [Rhizobium sp. Leaf306]|nr:hypothetical protein ASG19_21700 [Rhizobium sp. Leaf306]
MHFFRDGVETSISYAELNARSKRFARYFQELGLAPGSIVFLFLRHDRENYEAFIGAMMAGFIPSILPYPTPKQHPKPYWDAHEQLVTRVQPGVVITFDENVPAMLAIMGGSKQTIVVAQSDVVLPEEPGGKVADYTEDTVALLQHSSGTTGLKKGVMLTHRQIDNQLQSYRDALGFGERDVVVSWLPLYHDMGLLSSFLLPLSSGATIVSIDAFEWVGRPLMMLELIETYAATFAWMPNFAFSHIRVNAEAKGAGPRNLGSLKAIISCSEPVRGQTLEMFRSAFASWNLPTHAPQACYAMAETVFAISQSAMRHEPRIIAVSQSTLQDAARAIVEIPEGDPDAATFVSNGKPISGVAVRIATPSGPRIVSEGASSGAAGEIQVSGSFVFEGYFRNPEQSQAAFTEDGWYRTGDIGFCADGELFICGREKELMIIHGKNYYVGDVEAAASAVEGVKAGRVVAFSVFNDKTDADDCIVLAESDLVDSMDLRMIKRSIKQAIYDAVALTVKTVDIAPVGTLAKTTSGKMSRSQNRDIWLQSKLEA